MPTAEAGLRLLSGMIRSGGSSGAAACTPRHRRRQPTTLATPDEVLLLIEESKLVGRGIGYVDVQLLAATRLTPDARLWTRDRRLAAIASDLGVAFEAAR